MNKLITILTLFVGLNSWAVGPSPEKHPVDTFIIGVPSSSTQKNYEFNTGTSPTPALGVDTTLFGLNYNGNIFNLGSGTNSQKSFIANIGNGSTNPKIVWNSTNNDWEFSNDGTNFTSIGSGSGGSSGVNLLTNPGFESGVVQGWSNTGGTFAGVTSGSNLLIGRESATFTASASGQSVQSTLYPIPIGLQGQSCAASMMYLGGGTNLTFQVINNTSVVLASQVIQPSPTAQVISIPFVCPTSGTIALQILSSNSSPIIALDQMFLGQSTLFAFSQASYVGGISVTPGCYLANVATGFMADMTTTGCSGSTVLGQASSFASSGNGSVTFNQLPPGEYLAQWTANCQAATASNFAVEMTDGVTTSTQFSVGTSASVNSPCTFTMHTSYALAGPHTFKIQGYQGSGAGDGIVYMSTGGVGQPEPFSLYRFPTQSEQAVRPETINYVANAIQTVSGSIDNLSLNSASLGIIADSSANLGATGSATVPVLQPCSGGNASVPTGGSCAGGTKQIGVTVNIPATSTVKACASFADIAVLPTNTIVGDSFSLMMTNEASDTYVAGANTSSLVTHQTAGFTDGQNFADTVTICEVIPVTSAGLKSFKLQISSVVGATLTNHYVQNVNWSVTPVTQNVPAPILVGQPVAFRIDNGSPAGSLSGSVYNIAAWGGTGSTGYDTNNGYNTGTGLYTIPVSGLWEVQCQLGISSTVLAGYEFQAAMYRNGLGGLVALRRNVVYPVSSTNEFSNPNVTATEYMNAGDTIGCYGLTNVAGSWNCNVGGGNCFFEGRLIRN